ncbi:hypothetical protein [Vibrio sp. PNB22_4_1]
MEFVIVIVLFAVSLVALPILFGIIQTRVSNLDNIIEIDEGNIVVRSFMVERLFRLKGRAIASDSIMRIQFANDPLRGTCISLFNRANGAFDFWIPTHLASPAKSKLMSICLNADVVDV